MRFSESAIREVIIIGSGPTGYTAGIYTARAGLKPLIFEGALDSGGALMTTTEVENFPGFPEGIQGPDLMASMRGQAERFGAEFITDDVVSVDLKHIIKTVEDSEGNVYRAKSVILAMGSGYRHLNIPGEDRLSGKGVSFCAVCDGFFFRDKDIVVIGGGDSAVEEATFLSRFAKTVTIIHRRDSLRASKIMIDRAFNDPKIRFSWNSISESFNGEKRLESITLRDAISGSKSILNIDGAFVSIGHDPRSKLVLGQVDVDSEGYVLVDSPTTKTNLPGIFAAGDLVDRNYKQAITAAASGCAAALDAERYLSSL